MILTNEYIGYVEMDNINKVVAGQLGTWKITYTVGKYGIDDTGSIKIAWRNPSDWGSPQFSDPKARGYTTVSTDGKACLSAELETFERPFNNSILVKVYDGFLVEGNTITIIMGDKSLGCDGIKAQTFCEEEHEFRAFVDPYGSRRYQRIPNDISFPIYSGEAYEIQAVAPSIYNSKSKNEILIRAIDFYGNIAEEFEDDINVSIFKADGTVVGNEFCVSMTKSHGGLVRFICPESLTEGVYYFKIEAEKTKFSSISNPYIVKNCKTKLYFGDMHGQTSHTVGTGSLDRYFSFARDSAFIDFTSWQGNDFQINDEKWEAVRAATKKYNNPGEFVTFLGYEWSGLTQNGGDNNVYFFEDNDTFYPNSNWLETPGSTKVENNAPTLLALLEKVKGRDDVMIIPHIGGRYGTLEFANPIFTPVIEIHSHHGTFEWFIFDAMKARKKVGFIATSDDHTCRQGMSYPLSKDGKASSFDVTSGYTAIYADSLTKENVWKAIMSRNCYATTFNRMALEVKIAGHHMGEEVNEVLAKNIDVSVHTNSPIDTIELYNWDKKIAHLNMRPKSKTSFRIAWSGVRVRTRKKSTKWDGKIEIVNGKIISAEEYAFDRRDQGIKELTDNMVRWTSNTSGDYDGVILELDFDTTTELRFTSEQKNFTVKISDIGEELIIYPAGGENLKIEVSQANKKCLNIEEFLLACNANVTFENALSNTNEDNAYWVRVLQEDGHMAWSSPIFCK